MPGCQVCEGCLELALREACFDYLFRRKRDSHLRHQRDLMHEVRADSSRSTAVQGGGDIHATLNPPLHAFFDAKLRPPVYHVTGYNYVLTSTAMETPTLQLWAIDRRQNHLQQQQQWVIYQKYRQLVH